MPKLDRAWEIIRRHCTDSEHFKKYRHHTRYLQANHPLTLADAAGEYAGPFSRMWQFLPDALRANSTWTAPDVFGEVGIDDRRREGHHRMLRSYALHDYPTLFITLSLSTVFEGYLA